VLKGSKTSLFLRNVQLSLFSVVPGLIFGVYVANGGTVLANGYFYGYNFWTWAAIWLQAGGGLIVAMVVK
jgi:UDP-sugar transporter A1/2/3